MGNKQNENEDKLTKAWQIMFHAESDFEQQRTEELKVAMATYRLFQSYIQVGFTKSEAIQILLTLIEGSMKR